MKAPILPAATAMPWQVVSGFRSGREHRVNRMGAMRPTAGGRDYRLPGRVAAVGGEFRA
jgi:hypothetical protein